MSIKQTLSRKSAPLLVALCLPALLAGCAAKTAVSSSWIDGDKRGARYEKVLVIAMTEEGDKRVSFEDELAVELSRGDTRAWPSSQLMDTGLVINEDSVRPLIEETGAQAVVVTRVTDMSVQTVESSQAYTAVAARRKKGTAFQYDYVEKELPALVTAEFTKELTTDVVDAASGERVYTVVASAAGQDALAEVIGVLSDVIAKQLQADGVIR